MVFRFKASNAAFTLSSCIIMTKYSLILYSKYLQLNYFTTITNLKLVDIFLVSLRAGFKGSETLNFRV